jgi:hypothetical protein
MSRLTFQKNASYAFTIQKELEKNLDLGVGEKLVSQENIRFYGLIISHIGKIALTNQRIAIVKHFQFRPDIFYSINFKDITKVEIVLDSDIPQSSLEKFMYFVNSLTTRRSEILRISFLMNNTNSILEIFCWDRQLFKGGRKWKSNSNKTRILFEKLNSSLRAVSSSK